MTGRGNWTREEHLLAFNLYCRIPFGTIHVRNPKVVELAHLLGRSVGAVSYKLANFARLDPSLQERGVRGLGHGARGEEEIWSEFRENPEALAYESERALAERIGKPVEIVADVDTDDLPKAGREREAVVRTRVNQGFFRKRVLSAYEHRCCVTGLRVTRLLVASHIVPWAEDPMNRLNPRNGLCLNALHDRAFDSGMMWIDQDFTVRLSPEFRLAENAPARTVEWIAGFDGARLLLPKRFAPDPVFLARHASRFRR